MYPYRSPEVHTVHKGNNCKGYHVKATINNSETNFLIDTGAEVSLISADIPGLIIKESPVRPISITCQPIVIKGELGVDLDQSNLSQNERQQLEELIVSYADVFSKGKRDLGTCKLGTKHHIHLKPDTMPVKQRACQIPFAYQKEVKTDIKNMLEDGIIEKSCSEWASPLVIVRKSSGNLRICVHYRKLKM